jgi:sulfite reductase beta subunit-like hemoprotein
MDGFVTAAGTVAVSAPAFSGCAQHACGLTSLHDLGLIAARRTNAETGSEEIGFEMYVGGGLGAVPYQAKLFDSFVPPEELLGSPAPCSLAPGSA